MNNVGKSLAIIINSFGQEQTPEIVQAIHVCNAADDMLAALKGLVEHGTDSPEHLAAEAVIAKATAP